jgi:hypothetical protein
MNVPDIEYGAPTDEDFARAELAGGVERITDHHRARIRDYVWFLRQPERPLDKAEDMRKELRKFQCKLAQFREWADSQDGIEEVALREFKPLLPKLDEQISNAVLRLGGGKPSRKTDWTLYHLVRLMADAFETAGGRATFSMWPRAKAKLVRSTYRGAFLEFAIALFPHPTRVGLPASREHFGDKLNHYLKALRRKKKRPKEQIAEDEAQARERLKRAEQVGLVKVIWD